ncbi:MAG: nucleoside kinase [Defluviitaleaceae bacterium]|nr:nucleoside kinase [Defluviitaleaceae bacterium]MCL2835612.1 nucleoside kinase [Defluviitaleaceae bacterium]
MKQVTVKIGARELQTEAGSTIMSLVPDAMEKGILGAICNNVMAELTDHVYEDSEIDFLDIGRRQGHMIYQRSAALLMVYAVKTLFGPGADVVTNHSVNKNLSCELVGVSDKDIDGVQTARIEAAMREAVTLDMPIERASMSLRKAKSILAEAGDAVTLNTLRFRRARTVTLYMLGGHWICLHGPVAPSAGYIRDFKLVPVPGGFILQIPNPGSAKPVLDVTGLRKIRGVYAESSAWAGVMGIDNVGALNSAICEMRGGDIIRVNEALHEKRLAAIADDIHNGKKTIVLIAGPSSSGKTTFSHRLCVQLRVLGLEPHVISLDNYFHSRDRVPLDEYGKPDYESFDHVDREQLNRDLIRLLDGETVEMPSYNFQKGEREYKGDLCRLNQNGVLVIEGIHGLNDALTDKIGKDSKYKVFISAMTQINLDRHNRIPTSDTRLIRRIVRDMRTRGRNAVSTLYMWESVARGEEKNIFPYQESVDVVFNSALIYEMCVLKQYVEPLLFGIDDSAACKADARRLLGYLDNFVALPPDEVPITSILREFIGGSCFKV